MDSEMSSGVTPATPSGTKGNTKGGATTGGRRKKKEKVDSMGVDEIQEMDPYSHRFALMTWLESMDLMEYFDTFVQNGFGDSMGLAQALDDHSLKEMGITKVAHRMAILNNIKQNQEQIAELNRQGKSTSGQEQMEGTGGFITDSNVDKADQFVNQILSNAKQKPKMTMIYPLGYKGGSVWFEYCLFHFVTDLIWFDRFRWHFY